MVDDGGGPPHLPEGWFAVAFSRDLRPGAVLTTTLAGREIVVWRPTLPSAAGAEGAAGADGATAATGAAGPGGVAAAEPWCPHLGAHLGHGGTVEGTTLRCPFHGFRFAADGRCVATGYGTRPPATALTMIPVVERFGAVLAWHHPRGEPPRWEVPDTFLGPGWSALRTHETELAGHPQETSENSVDLGHLAIVHGYRRVDTRHEVATDGPVLRAAYAMDRPLGLPALSRIPGLRGAATRVEFQATLHGLGVSVVEAAIPRFGLRTHQLVLATPTAPGRITLRLGLRLSIAPAARPESSPAIRGRARGLLLDAGATLGMLGFVHDVRRDVPIWSHKTYLARPAIAAGDGPIARYRHWARQFY